jgi:CheY-like chemotaxis protein
MPRGSETILVAEDEASVRELVGETLTGSGYVVLEAGHGAEAIRCSERHAGSIDLLIADVVMPQMGGGELARRITELRPGVRVLFVSGYSKDNLSKQVSLGPNVNFLEKPFTLSSLLQTVRNVLDACPPG